MNAREVIKMLYITVGDKTMQHMPNQNAFADSKVDIFWLPPPFISYQYL